ncbi:MAG TPA: hypothetical protein VGE47_10090, partial [Burkholderiaceae bacterium]
VEHPSVAEWRARFPQDTVWSKWRLGRADLAVALLFVLIALLMGRALAPQGGGWAAAQAFGNWQVGWWWPAEGWHAVTWPVGVSNLLWALLLDLPFIVCWAWLLSLFATRAFARRAGLRRAHSPFPALLNLLGWSLTLAVFADLGEDLFSALTLGLLSYGHATWASVTAALMSACSAAKWLGLAAALMLILWGLLPARRE